MFGWAQIPGYHPICFHALVDSRDRSLVVRPENALKERGQGMHSNPRVKGTKAETHIYKWHQEQSRSLLTEKQNEPIKHQKFELRFGLPVKHNPKILARKSHQ